MPTISEVISCYLGAIAGARSKRTWMTYQNSLNNLTRCLKNHGIDPDETDAGTLGTKEVTMYAEYLKQYSPATEVLYLTALVNLYEYILAENIAAPNMASVRQLIRQRSRRPGIRLPQFPEHDIETLLSSLNDLLLYYDGEQQRDHLRDLRDRAFLLTLADTGLRVHEACGLRRGSIDMHEHHAMVIGKGNREAVVRFSERSIAAIKVYLEARAELDGASGKPLGSLPLFARHDKGAGKKVLGICTNTGRNIVSERVKQFLGDEAVGTITPHSFRHYFVTVVLKASGNLKLAQVLARHQSITVTQRYSHLSDDELDKGYRDAIEGKEGDYDRN